MREVETYIEDSLTGERARVSIYLPRIAPSCIELTVISTHRTPFAILSQTTNSIGIHP